MIRFRRLSLPLLNNWLVNQPVPHVLPRYRLRVWREDRAHLAAIRDELLAYVEEAFDDARRRIRRGFDDSLSPFNGPATDPAANYPALLHRKTQQGYWGETLAVIGVEHWGAHGQIDWKVPAFLFRVHDVEFQHLESINERLLAGQIHNQDDQGEQRPGRTGDDALAFRMDAANVITDILTLEAKCLTNSSPATIEEAHRKLASAGSRPSGVRELINLLEDYDSEEAQIWQQALVTFWRQGFQTAVRHDGVAYTCGHIPVRPPERIAWMAHDAPHAAYTAARGLECLEYQFPDLNGIVDILYRGA